ncbi:hypothetical protein H5392_06535 [Tessaracoccus sp. MC1865]|uniref:hypothetical protein n=1 Tax=Tessaracoccus sp. MC1865 TaxID=2760310 RepID=UPI0016025464|nr:hypothetical protein [Tessaracoccus sp. MC1865]MBB1483515.1 hypothetical protein [Tessaracoccus sp. MC1865]QTO36610.1 hypothetical protein J7D54_08910 [Tessaracoccus sp. MC1865]
MTTSSAVRFQIVGTPGRRVVTVSPAGRPDLHLPRLSPARPVGPGRTGAAASCRVVSPERRSAWLAVKVAVVSLLALAGGAVSAAQLVDGFVSPDPAVAYVPGDPAWAHVTQP